ncbi:MAG: excalibur calcium-binding domain-containing protein [Rhodospirillales bacterium]|nr:excalibur calcium-binding domain-containing protein [Rhodospirillales bacterium]
MKKLPANWHIYQRSQRRHSLVCELKRHASALGWATGTTIGVAGVIGGILFTSPIGALDTLKHIASLPNCNAARAVGLAPARRGQPGYWPWHDRNHDGIACEPWPRYR